MPEAVQAYVSNQDFLMVERVKRSILDTYQDDFSKYSAVQPPYLLRSIFETIPGLIGQKIKYSQINPNVKSGIIANKIRLLAMAKIMTMVYHSSANGLPLGAQVNQKIFKFGISIKFCI